jgi:hypothetical protein
VNSDLNIVRQCTHFFSLYYRGRIDWPSPNGAGSSTGLGPISVHWWELLLMAPKGRIHRRCSSRVEEILSETPCLCWALSWLLNTNHHDSKRNDWWWGSCRWLHWSKETHSWHECKVRVGEWTLMQDGASAHPKA